MQDSNEKIGLQLPGSVNANNNITKISAHELELNKRILIY
jgi:hypothetical protein